MKLGCVFCNAIKDTGAPTFIAELDQSVVLLNFDQENYPGRCMVVLKDHETDMLSLSKDVRDAFNDEVMAVAAALDALYKPERMNYANLGNEVPHLHWHIIPRYESGPNPGRPPWPVEKPEKAGDNEYRAIAQEIRAKLDV